MRYPISRAAAFCTTCCAICLPLEIRAQSQRLAGRSQPDLMVLPLGWGHRSAYGLRMRTRSVFLAAGVASALLYAAQAIAGQPQVSHPVVVELFTSQGC